MRPYQKLVTVTLFEVRFIQYEIFSLFMKIMEKNIGTDAPTDNGTVPGSE